MNTKKSEEISGVLLYPINIGSAAFIREGDGYRKTSRVLRMEAVTDTEIRFETQNTHYILHLTKGGYPIEGNKSRTISSIG